MGKKILNYTYATCSVLKKGSKKEGAMLAGKAGLLSGSVY